MKVEGLDLYYIKGSAVTKAGCMFELSPGTDSVTPREKVCLGANFNPSEPGKFEYGDTTIGVYLDSTAYTDLKAMFDARTTDHHFAIALSDGATDPTFSAGPPVVWTSASRSLMTFSGYIQSIDKAAEDNGTWEVTFTINRQSAIADKFKSS